MRVYTGSGPRMHSRKKCPGLTGHVTSMPETKALKYDYDYCPVCMPEHAGDVLEAS